MSDGLADLLLDRLADGGLELDREEARRKFAAELAAKKAALLAEEGIQVDEEAEAERMMEAGKAQAEKVEKAEAGLDWEASTAGADGEQQQQVASSSMASAAAAEEESAVKGRLTAKLGREPTKEEMAEARGNAAEEASEKTAAVKVENAFET